MDIGAWARVRLNEFKDRRIRVNVLTPGQVATAALSRTPTTRAGHLMSNTSIIGTGNMGRDQSKAADLAKALGDGATTGEWGTAPAGDIVSTAGRAATRVSCLQKRGARPVVRSLQRTVLRIRLREESLGGNEGIACRTPRPQRDPNSWS